jgi:hypothetical protein
VTVGTETWTFADGTLEAWQMPLIAGARAYNLELVDETTGAALHATYDVETRTVALVNVARGGAEAALPGRGCVLGSHELGPLNPRTTVIELRVDCEGVEVPGLGTVPIRGMVIVERLEWPE